jgi:signal peptidase II
MQAARGTTLSSRSDQGLSLVRYRRVFWLVAGVAYLVDLGSKVVAVSQLGSGGIEVFGGWFSMVLIRNPGAAFSTATGLTPLLTIVAIVAAGLVLFFSNRLGDRVWAIALGLLLAGIIGNLTDRLFRSPGPFRGHVVDFLRIPNWPVFNIADICINIAAALIVTQSFRNIKVDGTRENHTGGSGHDH